MLYIKGDKFQQKKTGKQRLRKLVKIFICKQFTFLMLCFLLSAAVYGCGKVKITNDYREYGYKSEILSQKDYNDTKLDKWIKKCINTGGYYEYIISDPDSWDLYIYYPNINPKLKYVQYDINLKFTDSTIKIYLKEEDAISDEQVTENLVLYIKAPFREEWPSTSEIYLNNIKVKCLGRGFQN